MGGYNGRHMRALSMIGAGCLLALVTSGTARTFEPVASDSGFREWAETPPMGWNSYDCYGATVTEAEVRANAAYMAEHLKRYGWEYVVIDYCWSYPTPPGSTQSNPPQFESPEDGAPVPWLAMDAYGRLLPDPRRFPSSRDGQGFAPLADYVHSLGLKLGVHVMRGIPRQAVWAQSPIKGAPGVTAGEIADTSSVCPWLDHMYGVDMSREGAQAYYDSLVELYAAWGVDYLKVDDIDFFGDYPYYGDEAAALRRAIDGQERPVVLSLSLNLEQRYAAHLRSVANLWRISADFWDEWEKLEAQFARLAQWVPSEQGVGNWPDADMLPLGLLSRRGPKGPERMSQFTPDEQVTLMTLWSIARSPLMMGGDLPASGPEVTALLSNPEVLAANQHGRQPRQLSREDGQVVWIAEAPEGQGYYVACFNLGEEVVEMTLPLEALGLDDGALPARDLWQRKPLGQGQQTVRVPSHGARFLLVGTAGAPVRG
ncbi:MAG: hypothetical protein E1N59_2296 [Puniceicoccaceae bacterium 5H]|nr:MAG: hypothetical protein E1N59_2296 [Puniceicoccaceae bacterium 5H]